MLSIPPQLGTRRLDRVTTREDLQRVCRTFYGASAFQSTGFAELDATLPGGGWPLGALTECLVDTPGIGELSIWIPALSEVARAKRFIAFIAPPFLPYPPGLAQQGIALEQVRLVECATIEDALWAMEQTLRCAAFGAVLAWLPARDRVPSDKQLRRLQLACETGRNIGVLYRPEKAAQNPSPAALRIKFRSEDSSLRIVIHKCRGGANGGTVCCSPQFARAIP